MSDFTEEIKAGRSLRVWIAEDCLLKDKNLDKRTIRLEQPLEVFDSHNPTYVPVILTLPPKPLEVTGYVCDLRKSNFEPDFGECDPFCFSHEGCNQNKREVNCQKVTLVKKGACKCKQ